MSAKDVRAATTSNRTRRESLMSVTEVADRLGVNVRYVRRLVAERRIPFIKFGHLLRFDPATIDRWVDDARVDPPAHLRRRRSTLAS